MSQNILKDILNLKDLLQTHLLIQTPHYCLSKMPFSIINLIKIIKNLKNKFNNIRVKSENILDQTHYFYQQAEQQIKLYCEQLQQQLEQFQQNNNSKNLIHQLKKEIAFLHEQNKQPIEENALLKEKIHFYYIILEIFQKKTYPFIFINKNKKNLYFFMYKKLMKFNIQPFQANNLQIR